MFSLPLRQQTKGEESLRVEKILCISSYEKDRENAERDRTMFRNLLSASLGWEQWRTWTHKHWEMGTLCNLSDIRERKTCVVIVTCGRVCVWEMLRVRCSSSSLPCPEVVANTSIFSSLYFLLPSNFRQLSLTTTSTTTGNSNTSTSSNISLTCHHVALIRFTLLRFSIWHTFLHLNSLTLWNCRQRHSTSFTTSDTVDTRFDMYRPNHDCLSSFHVSLSAYTGIFTTCSVWCVYQFQWMCMSTTISVNNLWTCLNLIPSLIHHLISTKFTPNQLFTNKNQRQLQLCGHGWTHNVWLHSPSRETSNPGCSNKWTSGRSHWTLRWGVNDWTRLWGSWR